MSNEPCRVCKGTGEMNHRLIGSVPCQVCRLAAYFRVMDVRPLQPEVYDLRVIVGLIRLAGEMADQWGHDYDDGKSCSKDKHMLGGEPTHIGEDIGMLGRLMTMTADRITQGCCFAEFESVGYATWGDAIRALAEMANTPYETEDEADDEEADTPTTIGGEP